MNCPCGSNKEYAVCCEPFIAGAAVVSTPEQLMRSRYAAYVVHDVPYIMNTTIAKTRENIDENAVRRWSEQTTWKGLEILKTETAADDQTGTVEFVAQYKETDVYVKHHELATFERVDGTWFFVDGTHPEVKQVVNTAPQIGRNDPCTCGSGKKYKKCCGANG